ncbi:flavin reductase family protein [Cyclobacterium roseum]|uniref:flavin reductase family protein n=1 Tax=Cyclobacterium roseum TaxID=2666137 RepID=UPI0013917068|nr:flavin reductase [Cyclobacterium roseum]
MKHFTQQEILQADKSFRRDFVNCLSGYKSLNLIGTVNQQNSETNLAPFSQVFHIGASPPTVGVLFRPHTVERHTLENIIQNGFFTLNHVTEAIYKQAHHCAARWPISEFKGTGLTEEYRDEFPAPYVKESPLKVGCTLLDRQTLSVNDTVLVIGSIDQVYVQEEALGVEGFIDLEKLGTVTVSGLDGYHLGKKLARLAYPKADQPVKEIGDS